MLTADLVVGCLVLLEAVDVAAYGPLPAAGLLALSGGLLALRGGRVAWGGVAGASVVLLLTEGVELRWQHTASRPSRS